ncbi:tetraspanin family protein [Ceratobasidium sp. AG-Ba]|nr:tetraspanin family protein [Ceratobasidium sp. AG-Ba]
MATRPEPKGSYKCCCCIPIRGGIVILTWFYFLSGVGAAILTFTVLPKVSRLVEITLAIKALLLALAVLSILLAVVSAIGIFATIRLNPRAARLYYISFYAWFLLQLALDIAVVVMFFTKTLDLLNPDCEGLSGRAVRWRQRGCDDARNKLSWWYTASMVIRSSITYYFVRRVGSFSRYCAERAAGLSNPSSTPMAPIPTFDSEAKSLHSSPSMAPLRYDDPSTTPSGTMFASNFSTRPAGPARTAA